MKLEQSNEQLIGILATIGAYVLWGFLPIYWKLIHGAVPEEILAHRIIWSFVFMIFILLLTKKLSSFWADFRGLMKTPKKLLGITLASFVISINWFAYIWAVNNNHVVEASLGYYMNPLVSVLLAMIFLKERLSFWQMISFFLALIGVLNMTVHFGSMPWVALSLAISFAVYGLLKKLASLGAMTGLTIETLIITPFALLYLGNLQTSGTSAFTVEEPLTALLLIGAGGATAIPLLLFASGANRIPLSLIGFLQYIAPTIMLIIGTVFYKEPFNDVHLVSFIFIWISLVIFSLSRTKQFIFLEQKLFYKRRLAEKKV
ncbi:EamA family transporter RarD [Bacillus taeanensis]|uniref:EamA family transporter RarD n=1 Tax=Bacillus taeanensis TaxID=273032 RepID=A0A366Y100_9BACI|nr:EamA family transporter RarD [Bacillus taeanensis]RBW69851.1 EamA family transporter RarD [Bacillus taeanensis]